MFSVCCRKESEKTEGAISYTLHQVIQKKKLANKHYFFPAQIDSRMISDSVFSKERMNRPRARMNLISIYGIHSNSQKRNGVRDETSLE